MPPISLVVCVHRQRDLLERLVRESEGCYDELIVLHDIPDVQNVREVAEKAGGRFFEREPVFLQEPHWPFAWGQAKHDWILRFDTDEFPSVEMKLWLKEFRQRGEPSPDTSGYTCIWPLWDGQKAVTRRWPAGRLFLFNKQRVRFFGMCEQTPIPDGKCEAANVILCHQPKRKSYGFLNAIFRKQSNNGAVFIAQCLLGNPTDLKCWRWESEAWPLHWEQIRQQPLRTGLRRLIGGTLRGMRDQWRIERKIIPAAILSGAMHQALTCYKFWRLRSKTFNRSNR